MISGENIRNLAPPETSYTHSQTKTFKTAPRRPLATQPTPQTHATFGKSETSAPNPTDFLRSAHRTPASLPDPKPFTYQDPFPQKPHPPRQTEKPMRFPPNETDFVRLNITNAQSLAPGPRPVDEAPNATLRPGFGQVPEYLEAIKDEIAHEKALVEEHEAAQRSAEARAAARYVELPESERLAILEGLRANWHDLHTEFMGYKIAGLTEKQRQRKEYLERRLAELERDIDRMEARVLVYNP